MKVHLHYSAAALAIALAMPQAGHAADGGKCKFVEIAKLPVVMEGQLPTVAGSVNGKETRFRLSAGAFFNFMSKARAVELGLATESLPPGFWVGGLGGSVIAEIARARDFGLAGTQLHNMEFIVGGSDYGGAYLGANLLGVWDTEFDFAKGAVNLFKESNCNRVSLAYWGAGMSIGEARVIPNPRDNDHRIFVEVFVNGHQLRALLDTGSTTELGSAAAARAGIDLNSPGVVSTGTMTGFGTRQRQTWVARAATISIGGEQIGNTPIRILDYSNDNLDYDMTLGVDFLMAHHVLVSQTQQKMFLTYNGGPIFSVGTERQFGRIETRGDNMGATEKVPEPKTADEFAARGSGRLTHGDTIGAIADFSEALRLAPARADVLSSRAAAYSRGGHPELAARDIDSALAISPGDHHLLTRRAQLRFNKGDKIGARVDVDAAAAVTPKGSLDFLPISTLYERLGEADRALAVIDSVIALHREDSAYANLLNSRCWNRALANTELDRALSDCNTAIKKAGPIPAYLDSRALLQYRRKDYVAAIADANAALDKMPNYPTSLYVRGLARAASGDDTASKADIAAARALNAKIDERYAPFGLILPGNPAPAQPQKPGGGEG